MCESRMPAEGVDSADWQPRPWRVKVREDSDANPYWITVPAAIGRNDAINQVREQLGVFRIAFDVDAVEPA